MLQSGFYWPTLFKDVHDFDYSYSKCQQTENISKKYMMSLIPILIVKFFGVWGIDFMGPFVVSHGFEYILVAIDSSLNGWRR